MLELLIPGGLVLCIGIKLYATLSCGRYRIERSLEGTSILITGATSGIGEKAAVELARAGAEVHIACRDRAKGEALVQRCPKEYTFRVWDLDVSSLESVRKFAKAFAKSGRQIHVLINNAGVGGIQSRSETSEGLEVTMATNHFGPLLLTRLTIDLLEQTGGRVVNVSSVAHRFGSLDVDDLNLDSDYGPVGAYNTSKLASIVAMSHFGRLLSDKGSPVSINSLHPGAVRTNLFRHLPCFIQLLLYPIQLFFKSAKEGSESLLFAALSSELSGVSGAYLWDNRPATASPLKDDVAIGHRLWHRSSNIIGLSRDL